MNSPARTAQRLGRGFWILFWILLLAVMAYFFARWEAGEANPNSVPQSVRGENFIELILDPNRQGHYVLSGWINGEEATFLLDTGASDVVIPRSIAERAGLEAQRRQLAQTANGTIAVYSTRVDRLQLGDIELTDVRASINPNMEGFVLLGMSALSDLDLHHSGGKLKLRQYQ